MEIKQIKNNFVEYSEYSIEDIKTVKAINNNLSNEVFYIELNNCKKFLIRYGHHNETVDRFNEMRVLALLQKPIIYQNPQNGMMIREWFEGTPLTLDLVDDTIIKTLIQQLKKIHEVDCSNIKTFNANQIINDNNFAILIKHNKSFINIEHFQLYKELIMLHQNDPQVLTHNDLNLNNIIINNHQINIIDFEWALCNNPYWDLASLYLNLELDNHPKWRDALNNSYGCINFKTLYHYCFIVSLMDLYWCLLYLNQTKHHDSLILKYQRVVFWFNQNKK